MLSGTTWKLVEAFALDDNGHELPSPLGPNPMGLVMFEAERMMGVAGDGQSSLPLEAPARAFVAYSGRYRFDGRELVTTADSASSPDLLTEQIRRVEFESPTRMTLTPVNRVLGRSGGLKLVWERVG